MTELLRVLMATLFRLTVTAVVVVFGTLLVLLGLVVAAGVLLWSLVTGRKPVFAFRMDPRATMASMRERAGASGARPARPSAEIIDIEAREVPDNARRLRD